MAIYQFTIELIPRKWFEQNKNSFLELLFDSDERDPSVAWKNHSLDSEVLSLFSSILPPAHSWHKNLVLWGDDEYSDIRVWFDANNRLESIQIRLDLRSNVEELKLKIVDLAIQLDCCFLCVEKKEIVKADIDDLNEIIRQSKAYKFVSDPKNFLDKFERHDQ